MSLASLTRTEFASPAGPLALWHRAGALAGDRPLLLAVLGAYAPPNALALLPQVMEEACDVAIMRLPGAAPISLSAASIQEIAQALSVVIDREFAARPMVLLGLSVGALVALAVRAAGVRRVVAVEPPLVMSRAWPLLGGLRARLAAAECNDAERAFIDGVFGLSAERQREVRYRILVEASTPTDVLVGDVPLMPPRPMARAPSLVDEAERTWLATRPGVRLHVAPSAGHDIAAEAPQLLRDLLLAACRAVAEPPTQEVLRAALLARTPLEARRVLYAGPDREDFAAALARRAPQAKVVEAGAADVVVITDVGRADVTALAAGVESGGLLVVAAAPGTETAPLLAGLDRSPWRLLRAEAVAAPSEPFDDGVASLAAAWRAQPPARLAEAAVFSAQRDAVEPPLALRMITFAPRVLDVRTRLPAQALRSDPALQVTHLYAPADPPPAAADAPKVLVLQRPSLTGIEVWRSAIAASLRDGWVVVMEIDDHPDLIGEVAGAKATEADWARLAYVHAVQTSTPALAEAFARRNPEVKVFANAAFDLPPFPDGPRPRRVVYGAINRGAFSLDVARALGPVAARFPEVEFLVIGDRAVFEALSAANKRFVDYVAYEAYLDLLGDCAVSLSPIEARPALAAKSDVKFVEAASRGVLTIASPTVYADTIRHGETGLIASRLADWPKLLTQALDDQAAQTMMAQRAWAYVRDQRMFTHQAAERRAWYQSLWARREALTAALIPRVPGMAEMLQR